MEVTDIICIIKHGKSIGPNRIPTKLLKILSPHISLPLSKIISESFQSGSFSTRMKLAEVIPFFKRGCPLDSSNYRPISLLSVFSKIIGEIMYRRLYDFLLIRKI